MGRMPVAKVNAKLMAQRFKAGALRNATTCSSFNVYISFHSAVGFPPFLPVSWQRRLTSPYAPQTGVRNTVLVQMPSR
jgi:hypothetical protein